MVGKKYILVLLTLGLMLGHASDVMAKEAKATAQGTKSESLGDRVRNWWSGDKKAESKNAKRDHSKKHKTSKKHKKAKKEKVKKTKKTKKEHKVKKDHKKRDRKHRD